MKSSTPASLQHDANDVKENDESMFLIRFITTDSPNIFELTKKEASLSGLLSMQLTYADVKKYDRFSESIRVIEAWEILYNLLVPKELTNIILKYASCLSNISRVDCDTMEHIVTYLKHHNGKRPAEIAVPI